MEGQLADSPGGGVGRARADIGDAVAGTSRVQRLRIVYSGGAPPPSVVLGSRQVVIRRSAVEVEAEDSTSLVLEDRQVSRCHAIVGLSAGGWELVDQGSRNGSYVDGARVSRAPLHHGSVIRVGQSILIYLDEDLVKVSESVFQLRHPPGPSAAMQQVRADLRQHARRTVPVLILGEVGVGKAVAAEAVHRESGRRGRHVRVACRTLRPETALHELFADPAGAWSAAADGTLFLDEISRLPPVVQPRLAALLAARAPGEATTRDVRVIAASERSLPALESDVTAGLLLPELLALFRTQLLALPPLRDRREDVLALAQLTLERQPRAARLTPDTAEALLLHDWPENVRELDSVIAAAATRAHEDASAYIRLSHLPPRLRARMDARRVTALDPNDRRPPRDDPDPDAAAAAFGGSTIRST